MGWGTMSERDLQRIEMLTDVLAGRRTVPYRVFSKDQRVSHTTIVENKRLGHALAAVKAKQDLRNPPKVMTNSEKTGYQKRTRMVSAPLPVLSNALTS
jgi:hypothetical protein